MIRRSLSFLLKLSFALIFTFGMGELSVRAYWRFVHHLSIFKPEKILYAYYPGLLQIDHHKPKRNDEHFDILLLGGSTLNPHWSQVELFLTEKFAYSGQRHVRCFNLAYPAHTSRDSWLKYKSLKDFQFDAVLLYQSVNEVRANNIAPEYFKTDYSHYSWYELLNTFEKYHNRSTYALGYTMEMVMLQIKQMIFRKQYIPIHQPPKENLVHGSDIKSSTSFREHISSMLNLAKTKGEDFFLISFASHIPEDYSLEKFNNKELDYGLHSKPLEVWGKAEHVEKALVEHNRVIHELAERHPEAHFIDLDRELSHQGRYFNDVCHFSLAGSNRFSDILYERLQPFLKLP